MNISYDVRVWEEVAANTFVEISANCPTCNQVAPGGRTRRTVRLPARAPLSIFGDPQPIRTFWIMPVVKTVRDLAPDTSGPFTELLAGGVIVTGEVLSTTRRCGVPISSDGVRYHCTSKRTAKTFNALKAATLQHAEASPSTISTVFSVSLDGGSPTAAPYTNSSSRELLLDPWSTTEPAGL